MTVPKRYFEQLILSLFFISFYCLAGAATVSDQIVVDQIGYRTNSAKWFMIKNPITGYDSAITYIPGASVQLRRTSDSAIMRTITLSAWSGGAEDTVFSGDQVWQGEFNSFVTPGTYHIYDPTNDRQSYNFDIGNDIYNGALRAAVKMFFYNRSNVTITAATGGAWTHVYDHGLQGSALLYDNSLGGIQAGTARNITKGWFDAGDYRKYTSWMAVPIWNMAYAYEWYPDRFGDATGIIESGNGVPDLLDEIKWELDWMLNMQRADGALYSGCFVVTGQTGPSADGDPSLDQYPYFYANYSTAATSSGAAAFAIGARLFAAYAGAYPGYSAQLQTAAVNAWSFLSAHTTNIQYDHTNFNNANANRDAVGDKQLRFLAAAELYRLTGGAIYKTYCDTNYNNPDTGDWHQPIINNYFETGASGDIQRGLVSYAVAAGATASIVNEIKTSLRNGIEWNITSNIDDCPYKAHMWAGHYTWGSNAMKAGWADMCLWGVNLGVNTAMNAAYTATAEEYLHYYFGRNATAFCFLTQSQNFGADKSVTRIFHGWFNEGTVFESNPAPGYLVGGPNQYYSVAAIVPPYGQPPMKSYKDWNKVWPDSSWEVTEPSTGYQAAYLMLNAAFAGPAGPTPTTTRTPTNTPYAGSPTNTYTRTPTPTNTPYLSPTATSTAPPFTLIYDGDTAGSTLSDGTVTNGAPGTMTQTSGGNPGNLMRLTYTTIAGWWQSHDWNRTVNVSIGANMYLVLNVRQAPASPGAVNQFLIRIENTTGAFVNLADYLVEGGVIDTAWKTARVPLADILAAGQTMIDYIDFIGNWNADYTADVDNIRLEGAAPTPTNTPAITNTFTQTRTVTLTYTLTRTITSSFTAQPSGTQTNIPSPTMTLSPANTFTLTLTGTMSPTLTRTSTGTFTYTPTQTRTNSPEYSPTQTGTGTPPTSTNTATITATNINTATKTATQTPVNTASSTAVPSATNTPVNTITYTTLPTSTRTFTRTVTPSPTRTITPTATRTVTSSFTNTPEPNTPTATPTIVISGKFEIKDVVLIPNPYNPAQGDFSAAINLTSPAEQLTVSIYTVSFRRIMEENLSISAYGFYTLSLAGNKFIGLANGTYYAVISGKTFSGIKATSKPAVLIIIK